MQNYRVLYWPFMRSGKAQEMQQKGHKNPRFGHDTKRPDARNGELFAPTFKKNSNDLSATGMLLE